MLFFRLLKMSSPTAAPVAASKFINSPLTHFAHIIIATVSCRAYLPDYELQFKNHLAASPTAAPVAASKFINSPLTHFAHIIIATVSCRAYLPDYELQFKNHLADKLKTSRCRAHSF